MTAKVAEVLGQIADVRWGLITTAQAQSVGVNRWQLSRMAEAGALERVQRGVYRMAGAPQHELESVYATWLALGGAEFAPGEVPPVVAAGTTAAIAHGIGDFWMGEQQFVVASRKTTRLPGVALRVRRLEGRDVTFADGLAVLTVEATIADLVARIGDLSLVGDALDQALDQHKVVHPKRLIELLGPLARASGFGAGDGRRLWEQLMLLAGHSVDGDGVTG